MAVGGKKTNFTVVEAAEYVGKLIIDAFEAGKTVKETIIMSEKTDRDTLGRKIREFINMNGFSRITKLNVSIGTAENTWDISWPIK